MAYVQTRQVDIGELLGGTFAQLASIPRELAIYGGAVLIAALLAEISSVAFGFIAILATIAYFPGQYLLYRAMLTRSGKTIDPRFKVFSFFAMAFILIWPIMIGMNLFYIPGLLLAAKWVMAPSILVAEDRNLFDAIGDSWRASDKNLLPLSVAFGVLVVIWSVGFAVIAGISNGGLSGIPSGTGLGALGWLYLHILPILLLGLSVTAYRALGDQEDSLVAVFE